MNRNTEKISMGRRILFSMLTLIFIVIATLSLCEILVRMFVPKETFWPVSNIYQTSAIPGIFYTYKPNYNGVAFGVDLKTNSMGFRGPEWSMEKNPTIFRIVLIGDSHAFGYGVPYKNSVGEVIANILKEKYRRPVEVLNFGVNGYNGLQEKAILEHLALDYDPDMVVLIPSNNDHEASLKTDEDGWLHWDGESLNSYSRMKDKSIDKLKPEAPSYWLAKSHFFLFLKLILMKQQLQTDAQTERDYIEEKEVAASNWLDYQVAPGPISDRIDKTVYQPLVAILTQLKKRNIPVIVAPFAQTNDYRSMFETLKRDFSVPVVELLSLFPEAHNWDELQAKFSLGWNNHLNIVAHRRFAEGIIEAIETNGYLLDSQTGK